MSVALTAGSIQDVFMSRLDVEKPGFILVHFFQEETGCDSLFPSVDLSSGDFVIHGFI